MKRQIPLLFMSMLPLSGCADSVGICEFNHGIFLEYLKIFISFPAAVFFALLIFRTEIGKKLGLLKKDAAGNEYHVSQSEDPTNRFPRGAHNPDSKQNSLDPTSEDALSEPSTSAGWWHFMYLNIWLQPHTKRVLKYLNDYGPIRRDIAINYWVGAGVNSKEVETVLLALHQARLIDIANDDLEVTQKGRNFLALINQQLLAPSQETASPK
jgi:hypothetical protein